MDGRLFLIPCSFLSLYRFAFSDVPKVAFSVLGSQPGPDLAARIKDGDLIMNSGFFDHPTACVQASHTVSY